MPSKYLLYGNDYKVKAIKGSSRALCARDKPLIAETVNALPYNVFRRHIATIYLGGGGNKKNLTSTNFDQN